MWKIENYDHQIIQTTVVEAEADQEGEDSGLLAYSTSWVPENYIRPGEQAIFECKLLMNPIVPSFEVRQTTRISKKSESQENSELLWVGEFSYFLDDEFTPTLPTHKIGELARETIRCYRSRSGTEREHFENGVRLE